ncbi:cytochrome P450 [Pseudogracilibacillus sp. SO30301A]|uniref:cytochrome P450 n=1 Tax=Pseudogracilibacillus sp. SO30301A TaxID=3098291 RepID=UPI00300E067D
MVYRLEIPKDKTFDSSIALLREGYRFIPNRRRKFQSDIFEVTLMGQKTICISGPEAAKVFYDEKKFKRRNAPPRRIRKSLFGDGGVQTLDDAAHRERKSLVMSLFTEEYIETLKQLTANEWDAVVNKWITMEEINLFQETKKVMCRIACKWSGVPIKDEKIEKLANELWALVDSFGAVGVRHWQGRIARKTLDRLIENMIHQLRAGKLYAERGTALYEIAWHKDVNGKLLDEKVAAVEVINILRPIVAISLYVLFGALALHAHPKEKEKLNNGGVEYTRMFTQEVRRYYPFTPFTGARVRENFYWAGHHFLKNQLVILDVYGMNHDERIWQRPSEFRPERFKDKHLKAYDFIPQGGGDFHLNHRCAGELVTITVMEKSFEFLTNKITYTVPKQNLQISGVRMPPMINSGFIIKNVERLKNV